MVCCASTTCIFILCLESKLFHAMQLKTAFGIKKQVIYSALVLWALVFHPVEATFFSEFVNGVVQLLERIMPT